MLNIGLVGCGDISGIYIQNMRDVFSREIKLIAVCDLIKERAEKAKNAYGDCKIYDTMEELFADPDVDIVLNLTRPYQHYGVTKGALLAGKHAYSEKPLAASLEEGRELVNIAKEKGLFLGGAPDTFMGGSIATCRKLIDEGVVGDIIGGRAAMICHGHESWHPDPDFYYQYGGGPLFDMGPYYITALINMIGGIKAVTGKAATTFAERTITSKQHYGEIIKVNTPTHIDAILSFENGANVSLLTTFDAYKESQAFFELYGTKGTILVPDPNFFDGEIKIFTPETGALLRYPIQYGYTANSRALGLADAARAIETGRNGRTTYKQTLHVLEVMSAILTSSNEGRTVGIESHFEREAPMNASLPVGILE